MRRRCVSIMCSRKCSSTTVVTDSLPTAVALKCIAVRRESFIFFSRGKVVSGKRYATEQGGRDRVLFFHRPALPDGDLPNDTALLHFATTMPPSALNRPPSQTITGKKRQHHLPKMASTAEEAALRYDAKTRDAGNQTEYRENDTQTNPYTPSYYIPDGIPDPEILALQGLTWGDGLPAGVEEVELIQRLRRRREVESRLPQGNDHETIERRMKILHELEEEEWRDREQHVEKLQQRRLESIEQALREREADRERLNEERLNRIRNNFIASLRTKLENTESKRMAVSRRAVDQKLSYGATPRKPISSIAKSKSARPDLIESYVKYGREAAPPDTGADQLMKNKRRAADYDIRPALLAERDGAEEVDNLRGKKIERVREKTFEVPDNEALRGLPSLYQRREAERVINSLEYAWEKIQKGKSVDNEPAQHVLDLYRATPKLQRPDTPELELATDREEEQDEACILLQRLLRGRAVQNDFFEGKERCRGLIEELQAASNAKYAERNLTEIKEREEVAKRQESMVSAVLDAAQGDIVSDTLGYLFQELFRQQDISRLEALRTEAEDVRKQREALEISRREQERAQRDREEVQYAAYARATNLSIQCFLRDVYSAAVERTAMEEAAMAERKRQEAIPAPVDPESSIAKEILVCDMLDGFVLPAAVDLIDLRLHTLDKIAPAAAALEVVDNNLNGEEEELPTPPHTYGGGQKSNGKPTHRRPMYKTAARKYRLISCILYLYVIIHTVLLFSSQRLYFKGRSIEDPLVKQRRSPRCHQRQRGRTEERWEKRLVWMLRSNMHYSGEWRQGTRVPRLRFGSTAVRTPPALPQPSERAVSLPVPSEWGPPPDAPPLPSSPLRPDVPHSGLESPPSAAQHSSSVLNGAMTPSLAEPAVTLLRESSSASMSTECAENLAQHITIDAEPVIPAHILRRLEKPTFRWRKHPSHIIVMLLLQQRGLYYPRYRDVYDYHMAELFLHYIDICREGSYFVLYAKGCRPKERFFRVRMCSTKWYAETESSLLPYLVGTVHKSGATIVTSLPLDQLVDVTLGPDGPAFRPFLLKHDAIQGCMDVSGQRATFPTSGTFRLHFFNPETRASQTIDLLTCDPDVYSIWTKTFQGRRTHRLALADFLSERLTDDNTASLKDMRASAWAPIQQ
eukprot:gene8444-5922_t